MQAVFFLLLAYCGITKKVTFLIAGYFLHGLWDLAYGHFNLPDLVPPHYDLFCLAIDFTIGLYLVILNYGLNRDRYLKKQEVQTH